MTDPQETQTGAEVIDDERTTLTDEDIETRGIDSAPQASVDDESDTTDTGDDTGDDSGDTSDTADTGDDTGDDSGDSNA